MIKNLSNKDRFNINKYTNLFKLNGHLKRFKFMNDGFAYLNRPIEKDIFAYQKNLYKYNILKANLSNIKNKSVLEVSCGRGGGLNILEDFKFKNIVGIDINKNHISFCKKHINKAKVYEANATNLPFKDKKFDLILSIEALFYYDTILNFFKEAYRVLNKNGKLVLSFSYFKLPDEWDNWIKESNLYLYQSYDITENVRLGCAISKWLHYSFDKEAFNSLASDELGYMKGAKYKTFVLKK